MSTIQCSIAALFLGSQAMAGSLEDANVVWDSPSENSLGSMPIGNGDIGANVWVEPSGDLVLLLSKTDAFDDFSRLLKIGRVRIKTGLQAQFTAAACTLRRWARRLC